MQKHQRQVSMKMRVVDISHQKLLAVKIRYTQMTKVVLD